MKKLLIFILCVTFARGAFAWGAKGHDVTAYIAECHLTPEAAAKVYKVLGGHSPVYYASWLDVASHTPEYRYTKTWHYLNIDEGETLDTMPKNHEGDVLEAVKMLVVKLKKGGLAPAEEAMMLKALIHLVGDMHCPMHVGRLTDYGGNRYKVLWFGREDSLHSIWDSNLVDAAHKWSYTEWREQLDRLSPEGVAHAQSGDPEEWLRQTHAICVDVYKNTPEGAKASYDYIAKYTPAVEQQFLYGGLRLARLLNEIYN